MVEPFRRLREAMVRFAVRTTAAHLERSVPGILHRWTQELHRRVPRYAGVPALVDEWGGQTLQLLIRVLRAEGEEEKRVLREEVHEHAHRVADQQLQSSFRLEEILQAMSLLRSSVDAQVQAMLSQRLWVAFPPDVLFAMERIHRAVDVQMLAVGQAYLEARDRVIRQREQELEQTNRQLRTLLQETHHRIKNNLQTVADLLYLEALSAPEEARRSLRHSMGRVKSIAAVHQLLSVEHIEEVDVYHLAERIGETIVQDLSGPGSRVSVEVEGEHLLLSSKQATSLALVLSELVTNAVQHAFNGQGGHVRITLHTRGAEVVVSVEDNGRGLPPGFDPDRDAHLGLQIVRDLVHRDLRGTFRMESQKGTRVEVRFWR